MRIDEIQRPMGWFAFAETRTSTSAMLLLMVRKPMNSIARRVVFSCERRRLMVRIMPDGSTSIGAPY